MLLQGKSKDTRARDHNTTCNLLAKSLIVIKDEQINNKELGMLIGECVSTNVNK
jgi:hypothetical protein